MVKEWSKRPNKVHKWSKIGQRKTREGPEKGQRKVKRTKKGRRKSMKDQRKIIKGQRTTKEEPSFFSKSRD